MTDPYAELAALAERGARLADDGRWEELDALGARRVEVVLALPPVAPADAGSALRRAADAEARIAARLTAARDDVGARLRALRHGRQAAHGYAGVAPGARVDQRG